MIIAHGAEEFAAACARAASALPIRGHVAGEAVAHRVFEKSDGYVPKRTGRLAGSGHVEGSRVSYDAAYAAGAEQGERGKWKGFGRYGGAGHRFLYKAADEIENSAELEDVVIRALWPELSAYGWLD